MTLFVKIGDQSEESVNVFPGDSAEDLAKKFAQKHGLTEKQEQELASHFSNEMQSLSNNSFDKISHEDTKKQNNRQEIPKNNVCEHRKYFENEENQEIIENTEFIDFKNTDEMHEIKEIPKNDDIAEVEKTIKEILKREISRPKAEIKEIKPQKENRKPISAKNHGHIMYANWLKTKESIEKYRNEIRKERDLKELEGATFRPKINKTNIKLTQPSEERLLNYAKQAKIKQANRKSVSIIEEMGKCPFQPDISRTHLKNQNNSGMGQMSQRKSARTSRNHMRCPSCSLYTRSINTQRKTPEPKLNPECTFVPNLHRRQKSTNIVSHTKNSSYFLNQPNIQQNEPKSKITEYIENTNRNPSHSRQKSSRNQNITSTSFSLVNNTSNIIAEKRKIDGFKKVFQLLDSDGDGLIKATSINLTCIFY